MPIEFQRGGAHRGVNKGMCSSALMGPLVVVSTDESAGAYLHVPMSTES